MPRKPSERVTLEQRVLFDPDAKGLTRTLTGDHVAYVELMKREPPPPHPSGQFGWKPKGARGTAAREASVVEATLVSEPASRALSVARLGFRSQDQLAPVLPALYREPGA